MALHSNAASEHQIFCKSAIGYGILYFMMRKILYCETNLDGTIGGSYFSLYHLVTRLDRNKYYPIVIFYYENQISRLLEAEGVEVHILQPGQTFSKSRLMRRMKLVGIINLLSFILFPAFRFTRFIRRHSIDLVHINNSIIGTYAWILASRLASIPCIVHQRGFIKDSDYLLWSSRRLVTRVICISKSVREDLVSHRISPSKLIIIHNGINLDLIITKTKSELRSDLYLQSEAPIIGISGTIQQWKGQHIVLKAMSILKESFPDLVCLIIGKFPSNSLDYEQYLKELTDELGIRDNIRFLGYQAAIFDFINLLDVPIHASTSPEPFGRVIIEAMALEKPIVASRGGGVTEIVEDGETGLLYTPGDWEELAACVARLLKSPDFALKLGRNGRQRVERYFHADETAKHVMGVYQEVLSA